MTDSVRYIGPRGWAALVLASGAALSAPFLRNSSNSASPAQPQAGVGPKLEVSQHRWPELREESLTPPANATNLSEQDWAELTRLQKPSGASPRKVTGELPSTNGPTKLPAWADHGVQVDQLVQETLRSDALPPLPSDHASAALAPLRPWMGHGLKPNPDSANNSASGSLPEASTFALAQPDPDARWSNTPAVAANNDSGATTSNNSLVRKFENHVKQWPDEIVAPPNFFENARNEALAARDATRPDVNWPVNAGRTSPLESLAGSTHSPGQMASTFTPPQPAVPISSPFATAPVMPPTNSQSAFSQPTASQPTVLQQPVAQPADIAPAYNPSMVMPPSLSAPMVSSQSGRAIQRPAVPVISPGKPTSDSPRPKHFIQQPPKRA